MTVVAAFIPSRIVELQGMGRVKIQKELLDIADLVSCYPDFQAYIKRHVKALDVDESVEDVIELDSWRIAVLQRISKGVNGKRQVEGTLRAQNAFLPDCPMDIHQLCRNLQQY